MISGGLLKPLWVGFFCTVGPAMASDRSAIKKGSSKDLESDLLLSLFRLSNRWLKRCGSITLAQFDVTERLKDERKKLKIAMMMSSSHQGLMKWKLVHKNMAYLSTSIRCSLFILLDHRYLPSMKRDLSSKMMSERANGQ